MEAVWVTLIDAYRFGCMVVDGKQYTSDLIIFPDRVLDGWWRKEGHQLCVDDITEILNEEPEALVMGTGYKGLMRVLPEVKERLTSERITLIAEKITTTYITFNILVKTKQVVGAFHITC